MHTTNGIKAVPIATDVMIIGEALVGGTLVGSYKYENEVENPEGASIYSWTVDGVEVATTLELRVIADYVGAEIVFTVTPVAASGEIGAPVSSAGKTVESGFQNISDEENTNSFMKQHGNFSFYVPEPSDRIFVSTGGAFSLIDPPSSDVFVQGQDAFGAVVPDAIKIYLRNNPATVLYSTERDFAALVPLGQMNQLLLWGTNIPAGYDLTKLRNIRSVSANRSAFAFIYKQLTADNRWIGAIGVATSGGTVPDALHLKLVNDPPRAIYATQNAFAVLTEKRHVYAWGAATHGGVIPADVQADLDATSTQRIICANAAFCALDQNGRPVTWGDANNGGTILAERLVDILNDGGAKSVIAAHGAFCAITNGRAKAVSWGNPGQGGTMSAEALNLAAQGNIVLCRAGASAFCMVNARGLAAAWGPAPWGGTMPPPPPVSPPREAEVPDMGTLMAEADVAPTIQTLFRERMRAAGVNVDDDQAVDEAAAAFARSMDRVGPRIFFEGAISLYSNDASFFLLAQDDMGYTNQVLVWGSATGGGTMAPAIHQTLMASQISSVYCTNGAYGVISTQGRVEGVVTVWGATLAMLDAGEIPKVPPEIAEKLSGGIIELYSIKRVPNIYVAPAPPPRPIHVDPSFAARHEDGSYVLWGGNVDNQVFVPGETRLKLRKRPSRDPFSR